MIKNYLHKYIVIIVIIFIGFLGVRAFFHAGYFPSHDGEWMVIRFSDFHRSLVDGQWPVRWAGRLNFGFGYPVFNFLYPGTFYLAEIFHLVKLNFVDSIKALFVTSYFLSGIFMYLFAKEWWGKWGGFVAAIIYLYSPYRFVDMYVRGSLGESVAFIFPPLIMLAITKIFRKDYRWFWTGFGAIGLTGLITTHNVIAYLFLPIIFGFMMILFLQSHNRKLLSVHCFLLSGLGLGASAFFWLPALWDKQFTIFDQVVIADFKNNFPSFLDLIKPSWGYGPSEPGKSFSMSFQIGVINLLMLVLAISFTFWKKNHPDKKIAIFFITAMLIGVFLMTEHSQSVWQFIPGLSLIQFPWRILSITTFTSAILGGYLTTYFKQKWTIMIGILIVVSTLVLNYSYTFPSKHIDRDEGYYATNDDTTTVQSEYMPVLAKGLPRSRAEKKVEIIKGSGTVTSLLSKSNSTHFTYEGENGVIKVNTAFFPGWEAFINSKKQDIVVDNNGLITLSTSSGKNVVSVLFKETPIRKLSDLISLVSIAGIFGLIFTFWATRKPLL